MNWKKDTAALIPCFNEARHIGAVVTGVRQFVDQVIVVDDGSKDSTAREAAEAGAEVVGHPGNLGKGSALRTGWRHAHSQGFAWAMILDGDGQHAPADIPAFYARAETTGSDLVVGDRMCHPAGMPWVRQVVNRWMSRRISRLTGKMIPDSQCGFRLARLGALTALPLAVNRFEIESEMLAAFIAAGRRVDFVPVEVIYCHHPSRIHPVYDTWRWLRWRWNSRKILPV